MSWKYTTDSVPNSPERYRVIDSEGHNKICYYNPDEHKWTACSSEHEEVDVILWGEPYLGFLSCPFCGEYPSQTLIPEEKRILIHISCPNHCVDFCRQLEIKGFTENISIDDINDAAEKLKEKWNTRYRSF